MDVNVRFYRPSACGFYPARGPKRFGSLKYLIESLKSWSQGKDLVDTRLPYKPDTLPAYLASITNRSGIYVVVLWIEVPATADNGVASIQANKPVGQAATVSNPVAPGTIPGFPCYFAVLPASNVVMSLRLDDSVMGLRQFQGYMEEFLSTSSPGVLVDEDDASNIVAYADELGEEHEDVAAKFSLSLIRYGERSEWIKQRAHLVRKIVRIRTLESARPRDREFWKELVDEIGFTNRPVQTMKTRIKYEMGVSTDPDQIVQLVDDNAEAVEAGKNDFGFVLEGDANTPHWLSNAIAGVEFQARIEEVAGMVASDQLLNRLVDRKAELLEAAEDGEN